ncbi:unnamed protein product [Lathyrus sativus]|nr:unnamed protein product [Lathyrus sativus]
MLEKRKNISRFFIARLSGDMIYEARHTSLIGEKFTIDLKRLKCSCRSWMLTGISCYHAISCIQNRSQDPDEHIPPCYRKETYQACYKPFIYPTNGEILWELTQYPDILPPHSRRAPERQKRRRNKDADEKRKDSTNFSRNGLPNKCSICGISSYNKSSCPTKPREAQNATTVQSQTVTNVQPQTTNTDQS